MGSFFNSSKKVARELRHQMEAERKLKEQEKADAKAHQAMQKKVEDDRSKFEQESLNAKINAENENNDKVLMAPVSNKDDVSNFKNLRQLADEDEEDNALNRIRKR